MPGPSHIQGMDKDDKISNRYMNKFSSYIFTAAMLSMVLGSACKDDDFNFNGAPSLSDDAVRIGATIDQMASTRTYQESGPVTTGKFLLTYPYYYSGADAYGVYRYLYHYGEVTFGYQGEETTGFVNVGTPTAPKELVWSPTNTGTSSDDGIFVYPSTKPSPLVLDNFMFKPVLNTSNLVDSVVDVTKYPENPFKAGIFDSVNGNNDLLWGKEFEKTGTPVIDFNLSHRMTRLILNVIVETNNSDNDTEELTICLDNASVTLTQVLLNPVSYRRLYGELLFQKKDGNTAVSPTITVPYEDFRLVRSKEDLNRDLEDENGNLYQWAGKSVNEATGDTTFTTQDFVFVPQTLRQGTELRPQIVIAVPKSDVNKGYNPGYGKQDSIYFKGNVPVTMLMDNGPDVPASLQTLNFDPGKVITLTTKMKPGQMELEFAPVTVEPWVYKGTFYPSAKQSGIYTADDLYKLIEYYNEGNEFWMHKFGYIEYQGTENERWRFMINSGSLEFEAAKIVGKMIPGEEITDGEIPMTPEFMFDFRNRDEYYIMPDGTKVTMGTLSSNLDEMVMTPTNTGVRQNGTSPEDNNFGALITAYQKNFWQQFTFGTYSEENEQWTFRVAQNVTLDYNQIAATMLPKDDDNPNFKFQFDSGVTVSVTNYPGVTGARTVNADELYTIVSTRIAGIYSDTEFMTLLSAIKGNQTAVLNQYGTLTGTQWNFPLRRDILIKSENIQGALNGVATTNYTFSNNGFKLSLYQYDGTTVVNPTSANLMTVLSLKKPSGLASADDFTNLISAYNADPVSLDNLSQFGYYCLSSPRWVFFFTEGMTLDRNAIQGSMIPDENDKLPFSFNLNYKQLKFAGESGDGVTGQQGAAALYEIVTTPKSTDPSPDQP